ncbi:MAG: hypothetical protein PHD61_12500, partial [Bacteroidales bacterium]|nr:hypothetical protein [Bacteroidales bacterium]
EFITVKSYKARGKRITTYPCDSLRFLETVPAEPSAETPVADEHPEGLAEEDFLSKEPVNESFTDEETGDQVTPEEIQQSDLEKDTLDQENVRRKEDESRQMEFEF